MKLPVTLLAISSAIGFADDLPKTVMTTPGKLLVDQQFAAPLPPFDGKSHGFASGFSGWRHNAVPRGGTWKAGEGIFHARETPEVKHPATASYGFPFTNVVIQCEVRMNDVPLEGRPSRRISVRTTDENDYVCSVHLDPTGVRITKDDNDHAGPDKSVTLGAQKTPVALDEWHSVVFEILGEEMTATVDGHTLTGSHPLIGKDKHSIMFTVANEGDVRNFKVWEAQPNAAWPERKAALTSASTPEGK